MCEVPSYLIKNWGQLRSLLNFSVLNHLSRKIGLVLVPLPYDCCARLALENEDSRLLAQTLPQKMTTITELVKFIYSGQFQCLILEDTSLYSILSSAEMTYNGMRKILLPKSDFT